MGGWTSAQGVSDAENEGWVKGQLVKQTGLPKLLATELSDYSPDLAIIGFGMNDATLNIGLNAYANNIKKMIDCIPRAQRRLRYHSPRAPCSPILRQRIRARIRRSIPR